jgi:hypothetical protein
MRTISALLANGYALRCLPNQRRPAVSTLIITRWERDTLHGACNLDLTGVGDVKLEWDQRDFAGAREFGQRFGIVFRVLDDLGWDPVDSRDSYELTIHRGLLAEFLGRQIRWAREALVDHGNGLSESREEWEANTPAKYQDSCDYDGERAFTRKLVDVDLDLISVCESLLDRMGLTPDDELVAA